MRTIMTYMFVMVLAALCFAIAWEVGTMSIMSMSRLSPRQL